MDGVRAGDRSICWQQEREPHPCLPSKAEVAEVAEAKVKAAEAMVMAAAGLGGEERAEAAMVTAAADLEGAARAKAAAEAADWELVVPGRVAAEADGAAGCSRGR